MIFKIGDIVFHQIYHTIGIVVGSILLRTPEGIVEKTRVRIFWKERNRHAIPKYTTSNLVKL